jgi:hypothetical protein
MLAEQVPRGACPERSEWARDEEIILPPYRLTAVPPYRRTALLLLPQYLQRSPAHHLPAVRQTDDHCECHNDQGESGHGHHR